MRSNKLLLMRSIFMPPIHPQPSIGQRFHFHFSKFVRPSCLPITMLSGQFTKSSDQPLSYSRFNYWRMWLYPLCPLRCGYRKGQHMAALPTAEACDSNAALLGSGDLRVLQPIFQMYGQCRSFCGPIVTVKVFEDNVLVRALIESRGEGKVLVIDGRGSMRCALVGGNLAQLAHNNGWAGIVVNGCIRDVDEINDCGIGVRALGTNPVKSNKKGLGELHVPVYIGGALIRDGEWLYADSDGVLVSKAELSI